MVTTMESNSSNNIKEEKKMKVSPLLLDSFSKLTLDNDHVRLQGEINLLKQLLQLKNDDGSNEDFKYSLKRLIRGLGSSKIVSKKGFYTSLTAYFTLYPDIKIDDLLQIMETELKPSNSISKSEVAAIYMGRILFCGSLMRSQLLKNYPSSKQHEIIEILLSAGTQRSYLSFVSISFLVDFIDGLDEKTMKANVWPVLRKELSKPWTEHNLDTFYALLFVHDKFPALVNRKFIKQHLGVENIIDKESMNDMLKLITDMPRIVSYQHPLYKILCEKVISTEHTLDFWNGIDQRFVKPSKSIEYLGLELLNHLIPNIKEKILLPSLLSSNFLDHMLRRFSFSKRVHNDEVANLFRKVLAYFIVALNDSEIKSKVQTGVLKKLIHYPGDLMIERITGVKVLQMITGNMTASGVKKVSKIYSSIADNSELKKMRDKEEPWSYAERINACQMLSKLLGHQAMNTEHQWRLDQLKYLFKLGFCEIPYIEFDLAPRFRESFYSALDHKLSKLADLRTILSELIHYLDNELFVNKTITLRTPLTESSIEVWQKMITFINKLDDSSNCKEAMLIFYIMDLNMGLQIFSDPEMAVSSINEIHSCFERLTKKKVSKKKKKQKVQEIQDEEPEWVDVIVDLLLSFLSKNSHLFRSLVRCVFPHICSMLTPTSIHQILEALDPQDERGPLIPQDAANDASDNESKASDTADDDEEDENEAKGNGLDEDSDDDDVDVDVDEDEDDDDQDETLNDRLKLAVRQALGDASAQTDDEDIDIDVIDEEEGKRLDESLAAAFRILREGRSSNKKKQGKAAEALTHFRTRVIDLLEIYLDSTPSMALALDMLVPLFILLEFCIKDPHQKPLKSRVRSCLKKLSTVKKFKNTEGVDEKLLIDLLKVLIEKGERSTSVCQEMGDKLAECCTLLIRCAQQANISATRLVYIFNENLTAFFKKRDCILPAILFKNILQLDWDGNWILVSLIIEYAFDNTIRSFRRGQALEFLTTFYKNHRLIKSQEHIDLKQNMEKKLCLASAQLLEELSRQNKTVDDNKTQNSVGMKEIRQKFVYLLWTLLNVIYPNHVVKAWDWKRIANAMAEYRKQNSLANDAKSAYNKLAVRIGALRVQTQVKEVVKEKKEKVVLNGVKIDELEENSDKSSDVEIQDESEALILNDEALSKKLKKELKKKQKNRSKQCDKQKLKKQARELREKAMSQGLETIDFTSVPLTNGVESAFLENGVLNEEPEKIIKKEKKLKKRAHQSDVPRKSKKKKHSVNNGL